MRDSYEPEYYRVPLVIAEAESQDSILGLQKGLKERLRRFNPKNALSEMKAAVEGIFTEDEEEYKNAERLFTMTNRFSRSEVGRNLYGKIKYRVDSIAEKGAGFFERNLEVLAFKHTYAYESAK